MSAGLSSGSFLGDSIGRVRDAAAADCAAASGEGRMGKVDDVSGG